ncbi:hypothetical protein ABFA07_019506 [Porites harrisoni]
MDSVHISLLLFLSGGFVLCLAIRSVAGCKISEASPEVQKNCQGYSPLCGNFFLAAYKYACGGRIRKRGNPEVLLANYELYKTDAIQFLSRTKRAKITTWRASTDPVEECCNETCVFEEVNEYC